MPSLKKLNLKYFHSFFFAPKQAFTLVELIVVISVLGVLATIAFTQVSNVTQSARNSTRMTNIQSISSSLHLYLATNGAYPIPDNKTDILYSGTTIGYQGYIKDTAARILKLSPASSQDPLNTSTYFSYATNASRTNMQLLGFLEANTTSFKSLPATFASDELSTKTPYSKGEELGILYTSWTTTPLTWTSIELVTTTNPYTAYYNSTDSLSGTGNLLQNLVISYSYGAGYGSPSTDDCPTGFIPVPGNKDFNQPGFCVAKYEMKQAVGDASVSGVAGGSWVVINSGSQSYCSASALCIGTGSRNFTNPITSKADGNPIASLSQYNAIEACKSMGAGYHLITNNEWMTLARNIESVKNNWMSGVVGSGSLYKWSSDYLPAYNIPASNDDNEGYFLTNDWPEGIWDGAFTGYTADTEQTRKGQKRTFSLSNGQIIWDLAGNALEHVNKVSTLDGSNHVAADMFVADVCGSAAYYSFYGNDGQPECVYANGYSYAKWWPATPNLNTNNGVGRISSYNFSPNALARGGSWWQGAAGGVYMFTTALLPHTTSPAIGFRCAK